MVTYTAPGIGQMNILGGSSRMVPAAGAASAAGIIIPPLFDRQGDDIIVSVYMHKYNGALFSGGGSMPCY